MFLEKKETHKGNNVSSRSCEWIRKAANSSEYVDSIRLFAVRFIDYNVSVRAEIVKLQS